MPRKVSVRWGFNIGKNEKIERDRKSRERENQMTTG